MACTVCPCALFSQHVWRKKKCNICFHAFNVHQGVTMGDNDECYIDGVLAVSGGGVNASASPPAAGAGSSGFTSPIAERQQAFTNFQQQPKTSLTTHAHPHAHAPATAPAAEPEKIVMVTSPVASGPPRRFAAPGSKAAASPAAVAPAAATAAASPVSTTVPAGGAQSDTLSVPASVDASSAAHPSSSSSGSTSKPSSKPASRSSSKPGSRRGSVTKTVVPGMVAEAKPYYVKALYSHVGTIPEQLSFKRNELLLIDGAMEGWLSASVLNEPERRGWIPSNYIERLPEGAVPSNLMASGRNKSKSRRGSDAHEKTPPKNKTAGASAKTEATPGPAIEHHMSSSHHTGEAAGERVLLEALYDFSAEEPDQQLSFQKGDLFTLVSREDPDWWDVRADESGAVGAVPALYMRELAKPAGSPIALMTSAAAAGPEKATAAVAAAATPEKAKPAATGANGTHIAAAEATPEKKAPSRRGSEKKSTPVKTKEDEAASSSASSVVAAAAPVADVAAPAKSAAPSEAAAAAEPAATVATAPSIPAGGTHRASFPFEGTVEGQLSYAAGDLLELIAKEFEAWWRFKHCATGKEGLVAATYVAELSDEERKSAAAASAAAEPSKAAPIFAAEKSSSRRSSASKPSVDAANDTSASASSSVVASSPAAAPLTLASAGEASPLALAVEGPKIPADATHRAAYPFTAAAEGQLSYAFGDYLRLVSREFEAWWRMVHLASGLEGLVAASYVNEITEAEKQADVAAFVAGTASPAVTNAAPEASASAGPASSGAAETKPASRRGSETKSATPAATKSDAAAVAPTPSAASASSSSLPAAAAPTHRASFPFDAAAEGQLSYAAGDLLVLLDKPFEAWWRFKHCASGQEGLVAATYVAEIPADERAAAAAVEKVPSRRSSASAAAAGAGAAPGTFPFHAALYAFTSGGAEQLDLAPTELVEVVSKEQPGAGWWTVRNVKGESGIVPANYLNPEPTAPVSGSAGEAQLALSVEAPTPSAAAASSAPVGLTVVTETPSSAAATAAASASNPPSSRTSGVNNPTHIGAVGYSPAMHTQNQDAIINDIANMGVANVLDMHKALGKPSPAAAATPAADAEAPAPASAGAEQEAVALYAFTATEAGQLSVAADEIVAVVTAPEHAWFVARNSKGEVGSIPENYVRFQPATVTKSAAAAAAPTPEQASAAAAFDASFPASAGTPQRRGTVMPGPSGSRGPPPKPSEKRHSVMASSSSQGSTVLATNKPLEPLPESVNAGVAAAPPAKGSGPPPLSKELAEHVRRMSISNGAAAQPAASDAAAPSIPAGATHRASFPFEGTVEGQLSYAAGDFLELIAKEFEAWWRFKHCATGKEGLVAATYVAELSDEEKAAAGPAAAPKAVAAEPEAKSSVVPAAAQPVAEAAVSAPVVAEPVAAAAASEPAVAAPAASDAAGAAAASSTDLPFHVALYSFESTADGQLGITAGEALRVLQKDVYDGWWSVQNREGATGMVPSNYLDPEPLGVSATEEASKASVAAPTATAGAATAGGADAAAAPAALADAAAAAAPAAAEPASAAASAAAPAAEAITPVLYEIVMTYDYAAQSAAELSATKGSVLSVLAQAHPGWLSVCASPSGGASATVLSPPSQGVVPESFARRILGRVKALYPYAADSEKGLLGLEVGSTILVVERSADGSWGTGWIGGQTGLFPLNYVE